jgi:hypothetical protein
MTAAVSNIPRLTYGGAQPLGLESSTPGVFAVREAARIATPFAT